MSIRRLFALPIGLVAIAVLSGCTPGTPTAYRVVEGSVDIAFCGTFEASTMIVEFGEWSPQLTAISTLALSGQSIAFGDGVPISQSLGAWPGAFESIVVPDEWERMDLTFKSERGDYAGAWFFLNPGAFNTDWQWEEGLNLTPPDCELRGVPTT